MLYVLWKLCQSGPKKKLVFLEINKGQKIIKRPNHFISGKLFQKSSNGSVLSSQNLRHPS
jgi:hypothetical protein